MDKVEVHSQHLHIASSHLSSLNSQDPIKVKGEKGLEKECKLDLASETQTYIIKQVPYTRTK